MKQVLSKIVMMSLGIALLATGCRKRDAALADNLVNFETDAQGLNEQENSITVKLKLSRGTDQNIPVTINFSPEGLTYGTDFTTTPEANNNSISLIIPSGNNETSFTITKSPGALFDGDEKIRFQLYSSGSPVLIGARKEFILSFSELVANAVSLMVDGGGASFPNKVFIDLSANRQTAVARTSWDLGFYTGADDFRVILNSSAAMMAKQINKNDLAQVTALDTTGFSAEVAFSQFAPSISSLPYIDYPDGDLTKTAIASISANAGENKVYIVNLGLGIGTPAPARGWKKIRIIRNASGGYSLQHADIAATTFNEIQISKDENYFFKYVSFTNGAVSVEPEKKKWDLAWTYFSNVTNFGGGEVPYLFQDIILQNRNVSVAKVMTSTKAFAEFTEADLPGLTFSTSQVAIGSDWRSGGGPTSGPAVRTDRYYIIKDGDENYYKVKFTALTNNGERGYPSFEASLVKRGL